MAIKNGIYFQVFFSPEMKKLLEKFSDKISMSQSKICRQILEIELPKYVEAYINKLEVENATKKKT